VTVIMELVVAGLEGKMSDIDILRTH